MALTFNPEELHFQMANVKMNKRCMEIRLRSCQGVREKAGYRSVIGVKRSKGRQCFKEKVVK